MSSQKKRNKFDFSDPFSFAPTDSFIWVSEFTDEALVSFYKEFTAKEADDSLSLIPIIISSYGGDVASLMAMRDLIKSSPKAVATIALGKAMSAGACLLAAGTKGFRFASRDTLIMIHEVSGGAVGKTADIVESAQVIGQLNDKLLENLAADCGIPFEEIERQIRNKKNVDWTLSAATAKKWGLIDHVSIPRHITRVPERELVSTISHDQMQAAHDQRASMLKELAKRGKKRPGRKK